jgi:hypothetical protein
MLLKLSDEEFSEEEESSDEQGPEDWRCRQECRECLSCFLSFERFFLDRFFEVLTLEWSALEESGEEEELEGSLRSGLDGR